MTLRFFKWSSAVAYQEFKFDSIICYLSFWKKKICVTAVIMWKISLLWKFIFPVHDFALLMLQIFFFFFCKFSPFQVHFFLPPKPTDDLSITKILINTEINMENQTFNILHLYFICLSYWFNQAIIGPTYHDCKIQANNLLSQIPPCINCSKCHERWS